MKLAKIFLLMFFNIATTTNSLAEEDWHSFSTSESHRDSVMFSSTYEGDKYRLNSGDYSTLQLAAANTENSAEGTASATNSKDELSPQCVKYNADPFADLKELVNAGCTPTKQQLAKLMDNPVGNLVLLVGQYDSARLDIPNGDEETVERFQFIPTFPLDVSDDWNLINRIAIPYSDLPIDKNLGNAFGATQDDFFNDPALLAAASDPFGDDTSGVGDLVYVGMLSPKKPTRTGTGILVWGAGLTTIWDTAEEDVLGLGKNAAGPAGVVAYIGQDWTLGALGQHWWDFSGDDDRADINRSNIQYFIFRNFPGESQLRVGMSPNISVNWDADSGNKVSFPVGIGVSWMTEVGKLPTRLGFELQKGVITPDDGVELDWNLRFYFIPVIPTFLL